MITVGETGPISPREGPDNFEETMDIAVFGVPGSPLNFRFLHLHCFAKEHPGDLRTLFSRTQAWDAIKAHGLSPACPVCGTSVLATESPLAR
jgi:hypothetical protein